MSTSRIQEKTILLDSKTLISQEDTSSTSTRVHKPQEVDSDPPCDHHYYRYHHYHYFTISDSPCALQTSSKHQGLPTPPRHFLPEFMKIIKCNIVLGTSILLFQYPLSIYSTPHHTILQCSCNQSNLAKCCVVSEIQLLSQNQKEDCMYLLELAYTRQEC